MTNNNKVQSPYHNKLEQDVANARTVAEVLHLVEQAIGIKEPSEKNIEKMELNLDEYIYSDYWLDCAYDNLVYNDIIDPEKHSRYNSDIKDLLRKEVIETVEFEAGINNMNIIVPLEVSHQLMHLGETVFEYKDDTDGWQSVWSIYVKKLHHLSRTLGILD